MSLRTEIVTYGDLRGKVFTFENPGDTLARHTHTEDDAHITIVSRGSFIARFGDGRVEELSEGHYVDTPAGMSHEFEAKTANARLHTFQKKMSL